MPEGPGNMAVKPAEMEQTQVDIAKKGVDNNFKNIASPLLVSRMQEIHIPPEDQQRFKMAMTPAVCEKLAELAINGKEKEFDATFKSAYKGATDEQARAAYELMLRDYLPKVREEAERIAPSITTKDEAKKVGDWVGTAGKRLDEINGTNELAKRWVFGSAAQLKFELQGDCLRGAVEAGAISKEDADKIAYDLNMDNIKKGKTKREDSDANLGVLRTAVEQGAVERMSTQLRTLADISRNGLDKEQEKMLEKEIAKDSGASFLSVAKKDIERFVESGEPGKYQPSKEMQILIEFNSGNLSLVPSRLNR